MSHQSISGNFTSYQDINEILLYLTKGIDDVLSTNLVGLYLFGSLTYGDFNLGSSDIDLVAIVNKPLNRNELELIKQLHKKVGEHNVKWRDRLECSYTPLSMLSEILPPVEPRPYYGGGVFYDEAPYGNEWIINNYLLYKYAVPLIGDDFKKLISPIDIVEVQKACIRDLRQEWEPKIIDYEWLSNSHYQSYLVMNLCRILYTVMQGATATKAASAAWVKKEFGTKWRHLIETAEDWKYGKEMCCRDEAIDFIKFASDSIKHTPLCQKEMADFTHLILISERVKLIPISMEYAHDMCQHFTPEVTRYMWSSAPKSQEEVNQYIKSQQHQMKLGEEVAMLIVTKEASEFLGHVCIHQAHSQTPELGIWLKSGAHGHHYAYEAVNLLKEWAKQNLKYKYLKYPVEKNNLASLKLAERLGGYVGDEYVKISESGNPLDEVEYWIK